MEVKALSALKPLISSQKNLLEFIVLIFHQMQARGFRIQWPAFSSCLSPYEYGCRFPARVIDFYLARFYWQLVLTEKEKVVGYKLRLYPDSAP